ncbi:putative ribonuclease H protein [Nymphaea thermarum]|nr:putative ribonuclease H protein [Nymphaea thermarum]
MWLLIGIGLKEVDDRHKMFTWSNHRQRQDFVQCKLDWCLVNDEWQARFGGECSLKVQTYASLDHCSDEHRGIVWNKVVRVHYMMSTGFGNIFLRSSSWKRTMVDCHMREIQSILPWTSGSLPSKYLSLPLFLGNFTEDLCLPLLTKVEKRLAGWKTHILSYAGLCLIRNVLMTLPCYWIMTFRLSKVVLKGIEQACIKFLWNEKEGSRHMHLVKWERLCLPLEEEGVGIRRLEDVNKAMLARRSCRLLTSKCPWAYIYKETYLSSDSL